MKLAILPGDGIGPEVVSEAVKVLTAVKEKFNLDLDWQESPIGGTAYDLTGVPLPKESLSLAKEADAVLLGAVGGPQWDSLDRHLRPEKALLELRSALDLFANLRPATVFPELAEASTLKKEVVSGVDLLVVRELTGGIYFGEPRGVSEKEGERCGYNTLVYKESEIARIAKVAFELAEKRQGRVVSVDKANVLEVTELWRQVVIETHKDFSNIELSHMYVDNAAMQLIRNPKQFDVIVTGNMFGDILSDAAAMLTGSIGMLPSASLNDSSKGMYEPVHGSAPDIAGQDKANPLATILSVAMMLNYSLEQKEAALAIEKAVKTVLKEGFRTPDIFEEGMTAVGTSGMGDVVVKYL